MMINVKNRFKMISITFKIDRQPLIFDIFDPKSLNLLLVDAIWLLKQDRET